MGDGKMTDDEKAAEKYATNEATKAGCFCAKCFQRLGDARSHYLEGIAYGRANPDREMLADLLKKFYYFTDVGNARALNVSQMVVAFLASHKQGGEG